MDNTKNDKYFIKKIISDIQFIINNANNIELSTLETDEMLTCAICFKFTQISESCNRLSSDFKAQNKDIPWKKISGLRNLIVHDYGNVKLEIIFETIQNDLPVLLHHLQSIE